MMVLGHSSVSFRALSRLAIWPPQARRMPGGTYLSSFLEAETDGTLRGGQLQPVIDYAAAHHYRFCPEQGAFLYCLNGGEEALQLVFCFQVRVEPENG